jgi:uncharacterized protein with PIN domain
LILEEKVKSLLQDKETNKQTIEEYQRMIFHKKSKSCDKETAHKSIFNEAKNIKRTKESYKKELPKKNEITDSFEYGIDRCPQCETKLVNFKKYKKYIEDID